MPKQTRNQVQSTNKRNKKNNKIAKVHIPNEALKEKGCCLDTKSPAAKCMSRYKKHRYKRAFEFFTQRSKGHKRSKKKKGSQENAVGKNAKRRYSALFIGGQPLEKTKRTAMPSLKRHIAWGYTGSAARHKGLFGSRTPTRHVAQSDEETSSSFKKPVIFLTRPFFGQNRQVKKGGNVGTPPSGKHVARISQ